MNWGGLSTFHADLTGPILYNSNATTQWLHSSSMMQVLAVLVSWAKAITITSWNTRTYTTISMMTEWPRSLVKCSCNSCNLDSCSFTRKTSPPLVPTMHLLWMTRRRGWWSWIAKQSWVQLHLLSKFIQTLNCLSTTKLVVNKNRELLIQVAFGVPSVRVYSLLLKVGTSMVRNAVAMYVMSSSILAITIPLGFKYINQPLVVQLQKGH